MPNWTTNIVTIKGSQETLEKIKQSIFTVDVEDGETIIDFGILIPKPEELENTESGYDEMKCQDYFDKSPDKLDYNELMKELPEDNVVTEEKFNLLKERFIKYKSVDWYNWNVRNWGCKWNGSGLSINTDESDTLEFEFISPWCEPLQWLDVLTDLYQDVDWKVEVQYEGGDGGQIWTYDSQTKEEGIVKTLQVPVIEDDNGEFVFLKYNDDLDGYFDPNGVEIEDYDWTFLPVDKIPVEYQD
jgi:hypothetical protein